MDTQSTPFSAFQDQFQSPDHRQTSADTVHLGN